MKNFSRVLALLFALATLAAPSSAATCSGGANCNACTNCRYCGHCGAGGTCSVCRPDLYNGSSARRNAPRSSSPSRPRKVRRVQASSGSSPSQPHHAVGSRRMKKDMSGTDVLAWQQFLIARGFLQPPALGNYGPRTTKATLAFQRRYKLVADGIAGPQTIRKARALGFGR